MKFIFFISPSWTQMRNLSASIQMLENLYHVRLPLAQPTTQRNNQAILSNSATEDSVPVRESM